MDNSMEVPLEELAQAVAEQRNAALDELAQWKAVARALKAENDRLNAERTAVPLTEVTGIS